MAVYTEVMIYCFKNFESERSELKQTTKYLLSKGFIKIKNASLTNTLEQLTSEEFEQQINTLSKKGMVSNVFSVARILSELYKIIKCDEDAVVSEDNDYKEALDEIGMFLSKRNKKMLVLIDSFEEYKLNDREFLVAIKSLILACFQIYSQSFDNGIYFKMALASEMYTRVLTHLPAKNQTNTVPIIWSFRDLIKCMAVRFVSWYHDADPKAKYKNKRYLFDFLSEYSLSDLKDSKHSYETSEKIFYKILPRICKTNSSYTYLTLAFISRHTMKKPREFLQVFNAVLDRIIYEDNNKYFLDDNGKYKIKDVVHSLQNDFIRQTLSLYQNFIPKIDTYIDRLLHRSDFIFYITQDDFEKNLKDVNALIRSETGKDDYLYYFDKYDFLNIVFETVLLGTISRVKTIDTGCINQFGTDKPIKIIDALFEYQSKGKIQKNKDMQYVVHPMCYEHYNCRVGMRSMINTDSYDSTELLTSVISDE